MFVTLLELINEFCLAGDLDTAKVLSLNAKATTVVGTPGYMAPEILIGNKYSHEVDGMFFVSVYALYPIQSKKSGRKPTPTVNPKNRRIQYIEHLKIT